MEDLKGLEKLAQSGSSDSLILDCFIAQLVMVIASNSPHAASFLKAHNYLESLAKVFLLGNRVAQHVQLNLRY